MKGFCFDYEGQVVFDALGQGQLGGVKDIASALVDGLVSLRKEKSVRNTLKQQHICLHRKCLMCPQTEDEDTEEEVHVHVI